MSDLLRLIEEETFPYEFNDEFEVVTNVKVVEAARLVASGEVVAKTDLQAIRWCVVHESKAFWRSNELCERAMRPSTSRHCSIVSAGLYLEGEAE